MRSGCRNGGPLGAYAGPPSRLREFSPTRTISRRRSPQVFVARGLIARVSCGARARRFSACAACRGHTCTAREGTCCACLSDTQPRATVSQQHCILATEGDHLKRSNAPLRSHHGDRWLRAQMPPLAQAEAVTGSRHVAARYRKRLCAGGENVLGMRLGQGKYGYVYEFCAAGDAT